MNNFISFLAASYPTLDHVLRHSSMHPRFIVSAISSLSQESLEASQSGWMYKSRSCRLWILNQELSSSGHETLTRKV